MSVEGILFKKQYSCVDTDENILNRIWVQSKDMVLSETGGAYYGAEFEASGKTVWIAEGTITEIERLVQREEAWRGSVQQTKDSVANLAKSLFSSKEGDVQAFFSRDDYTCGSSENIRVLIIPSKRLSISEGGTVIFLKSGVYSGEGTFVPGDQVDKIVSLMGLLAEQNAKRKETKTSISTLVKPLFC